MSSEFEHSFIKHAHVLANADSLAKFTAVFAQLDDSIIILDSSEAANTVLPHVAKSFARGLSLIAGLDRPAFMQLNGTSARSITIHKVQLLECLRLLVVTPTEGGDAGTRVPENVQTAASLAKTGANQCTYAV